MVSPTRRVLGAKDSNAPVHVQDPQCKSQATAGQADPVSRLSVRRPLSPSSDSVPGSPRAGQKRRIDEIEEEDHNNDSPRTNATHLLSQRTELLSDSGSDRGTTSPPSLTQTKSTMNTTSTTSFHPSQEESSPIEVQFEIREEISQQTLDNMVGMVRSWRLRLTSCLACNHLTPKSFSASATTSAESRQGDFTNQCQHVKLDRLRPE